MKIPLLLSLCVLSSLSARAEIIYVDFARGGGFGPGQNGRSWNQCLKYLSDALASAAAKDEIWVTGGTHYPGTNTARSRTDTFQLRSGVTVRGGYRFGQTSSIPENLEPTILSGDIGTPGNINDNCYHVVTGTGAGGSFDGRPTLLENVTITGGNADGTDATANVSRWDVGGGLICDPISSPVLRNVIITGNHASRLGGGAFLNGSGTEFEQVTFSNNTVTGASSEADAGHGGGLYSIFSNGRIEGCVFTQNSAIFGGAISNYGSNQTISNSRFLGNTATISAGAIHNTGSSAPTIADCTFSGNDSTKDGGAVSNFGSSTPSFNRCEFVSNRARGVHILESSGGAVSSRDNSAPTFQDCSFTLNSSSGRGGALSFWNSTVSVKNCSFDQNIAYYGGAIVVLSSAAGIQRVKYSTFHANKVWIEGSGGAIYCFDSPLLIQNSSFQGNTAGFGGGLAVDGSPVPNLNNCAFWDNRAIGADTHSSEQSVWHFSTEIVFRHCLIEGRSAASLNDTNASSFDNFDGTNPANDPLFAPYGYYGGPTKTLPPLPGSFAIDPIGGHTAIADTDQRGFPSPVGAGGIFDIGAVEIQGEADLLNISFDIDVDGDGATNGLELAVGTDPSVADPKHGNPIRQYYVNDGDFIDRGHWLEFPTSPRANELSLRLMKSTDLINFEPVPSVIGPGSTSKAYKIPDLEGGQVFYRLEASRP